MSHSERVSEADLRRRAEGHTLRWVRRAAAELLAARRVVRHLAAARLASLEDLAPAAALALETYLDEWGAP